MSTDALPINQDLVIIEKSVSVLAGASEIIRENIERSDKAVIVGQRILDSIEANGGKMNEEIFDRAKVYILKCAEVKKELNANRKPVTAIIDLITKACTGAENSIDVAKVGTKAYDIQRKQNEYVKLLADLAEKERLRQLREANKIKERGTAEATITQSILSFFNVAISQRKAKMTGFFDTLSLDKWDEGSNIIKNASVSFPDTKLAEWRPQVNAIYLDPAEVEEIKQKVEDSQLVELIAKYNADVAEHQRYLADRLESRRLSLVELANANAERQRQLQAEEEERRTQELARQQELDRAAQEAAEQRAAMITKQAETTAFFQQQTASPLAAETPKTKKKWLAIPVHPGAYALMFEMWFKGEGKDMELSKMATVTLERINNYVTKMANDKSGTKIESSFIKYEEDIKAVNRKTKD